jgi:hypothetical protein
MVGIFGHRWTSNYGEDPRGHVADTWSRALADLPPSQITRGIEAAAHGSDGWPPSLPEFRALCLGIPTIVSVKVDLRREREQRHPFTRLVWQYVDAHLFGMADQRTAAAMIRDAYDHARELVMTGQHALDFAPLAQLPPPRVVPVTPANPAHVRAVFDDLGSALGVSPMVSLGAKCGVEL